MRRKTRKKENTNSIEYKKFEMCINDLSENIEVNSMEQFIHHGNTSCFEHSKSVAYISDLVCKKLGLDYNSAARGGLLHDFYLYDWHIKSSHVGLHGFNHPHIASKNAQKYFSLNKIEIDIIEKHMWPLTFKLPKYKESFVVLLVDKYCSFFEIIQFRNKTHFSTSKN